MSHEMHGTLFCRQSRRDCRAEAGSSIFAVIYASVTIWSAVLSRLLLEHLCRGLSGLRAQREKLASEDLVLLAASFCRG